MGGDQSRPAAQVSIPELHDDVTVTVEPMRNKQWIQDGQTERHGYKATTARGLALKLDAASEVSNWHKIDAGHPGLVQPTEMRSVHHSASFAAREDNRGEGKYNGPHHYRGALRDMTRHGALPVISHLHRTGQLAEKSTGDIEAEMREAERTRGARMFP